MIKKIFLLTMGLIILGAIQAQDYKLVKVDLKEGITLKGKDAILTRESISFLSGGAQKTFPLSDVNLIQAKEGKAGKWALGFGGGCLAIGVIAGVASGTEGIEEAGGTVGLYAAGLVIWTAAFTGLGYLVGNLVDQWDVVYNKNTSSLLKNFNFNVGSNQYAGINFTLSYKLPLNH